MDVKRIDLSPDVSRKVVSRLPRYYRYLRELLSKDVRRINSKELASLMGVTASQIRQDLNCFGDFGRQGYGYNVPALYDAIGEILGVNERFRAVIIGMGNLGSYLVNSKTFRTRGVYLKGLFDVDPCIIGKDFSGMTVMDMSELTHFVAENRIDIAVLTVPKEEAPAVFNRLCDLKIRGVWNFTGCELGRSEGVVVQNVHLGDLLMNLCYLIHEENLLI